MLIESLLNEQQAAEILCTTPKNLQTWRCRGRGPKFCKIGAAVRYDPADLREFISASKREPGLLEQPIIPEQFRWRKPKHRRS